MPDWYQMRLDELCDFVSTSGAMLSPRHYEGKNLGGGKVQDGF
jgi:hypothetical protein